MSERLLDVDNVEVEYPARGLRGKPFKALKGVSLDILPGETVGLVGESGSGKTTLGRAVLGLAPVTGGAVRYRGRDISHLSRAQRRELSSDIQVVFQDPYTSLNPALTIEQIPQLVSGTLIAFAHQYGSTMFLIVSVAIMIVFGAVLEGAPGRLMRSLKSVLGTSLIDETTRLGRERVSFRDVIAYYLGAVKRRAEQATGHELRNVVHGRPVHFVDNAPDADRKAEETLRIIARGIGFDEVQEGYVGYVYGESTSGQRALYELGMTGIPIVNVNNNCASGVSGLFLARQAVRYGQVDCALAVGFEKIRCVWSYSTSTPVRLSPSGLTSAVKKAVRSLTRAACCMLWVTMTIV